MKTESLNPIKLLAMLGMAFALVLFTGCGEDDGGDDDGGPTGPTMTLMEMVDSTTGLDSLSKFLNLYPDLVTALNADGDMTLFAPNNGAFVNLMLTIGTEDLSFVNPQIIEDVLKYHVSSTRYDEPFTVGDEIPTTQGENIKVNQAGNLETGGTALNVEVLDSDEATNGKMHTTGSVLIPPSIGNALVDLLGTNAAVVLLSADFTIMGKGVTAAETFVATNPDAGLTPVLSIIANKDLKNTLFAVPDVVFEQVGMDENSLSGQEWYAVIMNHIILDDTSEEDYEMGASFPSALKLPTGDPNTLTFYLGDPTAGTGIYIDGNGDQDPDGEILIVDDVDLQSSNGRVQVFAGLLLPPQ